MVKLSLVDSGGSRIYDYVLVGGVAALCFYICNAVYNAFFSPISSVPGPLAARFTRLWELIAVYRGDFHKTNQKLHEQYGSVVRLAPNRFSVSDPSAIRTILGHGAGFSKSAFYAPFGAPDRYNLFSEPKNAKHAAMRRRISMLYSTSALLSYEGFVDSCTSTLMSKFREFAKAGVKVPMCSFLQYYAFDVIGDITVNQSFGLVENEGDVDGIIQAIDDGNVYAAHVGLFPEFHKFVGLVVKHLQLEPSLKVVANFIQHHLDLRVKDGGNKERQDMVTKLLALEASGKNTRFDTFTGCAQNLAAGSDTTGISLSSVMYFLHKYPNTLKELRRQLDAAEANGRISDPITFKEAQDLPYLKVVIMEGLRIHPAVDQSMVRVVPDGGAKIAGRYFPPGAEVGINPWVIHHHKDIFGEDASDFRPERWLCDPAVRSKLNQGSLAFGAGARTCIGKNISLLELSKAIPQLVRNFEFKLVSP